MPRKTPYKVAFVACNRDCVASFEQKCVYGCISCGNCEAICKFNAIKIDFTKGVATVDESKCMGCGMCVSICPQHIIRLRDAGNFIGVKCSNKDKGVDARKMCKTSCIGCGMCERTCTADAIHVTDNLACIEDEKCLSCGFCAVKCPQKAIKDYRKIITD